MRLTRRALLQMGVGIGSGIALHACRRPSAGLPEKAPAPRESTGLRYCVVLFLRGGIDAIFNTDPRRASEVEAGVDVPYPESAIVESGGLRLGPHLRPLVPSLPRTAILNGVRVHTANHETGAAQVVRMRTSVLPAMPSLLDIIGGHREGQPLACVSLGNLKEHEHSQRWFSNESLKLVDDTAMDDRALLAKVMRAQAGRLASVSSEQRIARENLLDCASFFDRSTQVPLFQRTSWGESPSVAGAAIDLQRTLWLLENDLTKTVFAKAYLPWDTHERNTVGQTAFSPPYFEILARFFAELGKRSNAYGPLSETTRVVVMSEVGRFPRLNGDQGKDHFPELPILFHGPRLATNGGKGAVHGRTGRNLEALPLDPRTGAAGSHFARLDDVGATLLHSFGIAPESYGYDGRILDFLGMT
jgi:hypothetical protein